MASEEGGNAATVLVAFVLGAVAGAAVALLWAPASGEDTRRFITDKAREGREKASQLVAEGRDYVNRQREGVSAAIERGREAFHQAREKEQT